MSRWRAKQYKLAVGRRSRLLLTVRRFHTPTTRRTTRYKQLIVPIDAWGIREIALRFEHKRPAKRRQTFTRQFWRVQVSVPFVLIMCGVSGSGFFGTQLVAAHAEPVSSFTSAPTAHGLASKALPYSVPTHISIPSVSIDADIIPVGLASDGSMDLPPLFSWETGWYKYSPTPGQVGPAIIAGHVDTYKGTSVFWTLRNVHRGDLVHITRTDGKIATFKITTLEQYSQHNFPTAKVYGNINYPGLRLITCGGSFDETTHSYTENTVVSAFLVTT